MNDVVSLAVARAKPDADIVEKCEWLLEKAKSGEVRELAFIVQMDKSAPYESWASKTEDSMRQVGMIDRLKHRVHRNIDRAAGENG